MAFGGTQKRVDTAVKMCSGNAACVVPDGRPLLLLLLPLPLPPPLLLLLLLLLVGRLRCPSSSSSLLLLLVLVDRPDKPERPENAEKPGRPGRPDNRYRGLLDLLLTPPLIELSKAHAATSSWRSESAARLACRGPGLPWGGGE